MRSSIFVATIATVISACAAGAAPTRPPITGISHISVYSADPARTESYYTDVVGAVKAADPENAHGVRYMINATQFVEVLPLPAGEGKNRLDHIAFKTTNVAAMRAYLSARGWATPAAIKSGADGSKWLDVKDAEGYTVEFVQPPVHPAAVHEPNAIGPHVIHVGIIVHDRAKEDTFYRGLLDFKPYWYGGMQDTKVDWVSQQTPESHDWLEYMVVGGEGTGIPASMSQHTAGVLNHVSIGVVSVDAAFKTLKGAGRLKGEHDDAPKMGRDGKMQLNLYDPDETRVEVMNFRATEKPCCSQFTAQDPSPVE